MTAVCLDTHVLIWGIQGKCSPGQELMVHRSKALIDRLDKGNKQMFVPTVVVGEFLAKIPIGEHQSVMGVVQKRFMVVQYDLLAAMWYARIWNMAPSTSDLDDLKKAGKSRQELKADRMIVATAKASGAECIYSHDPGVATFGRGIIEVLPIPDAPQQTTMF
jgi:predicted nucleic acid-binding protein